MGARFTPDVSSFEKLLAAAWILQCQRDEMAGTAKLAAAALGTETPNPAADLQTLFERASLEEKNFIAEQRQVVCVVADPGPALPAVASMEKQEVEGLPVLAESLNCEGAFDPAPIAAAAPTETESQEHALLRAISRLTAISSSAQESKKSDVAITFKLVIPGRSMKILRASLVPVVVLLVIGGFLLSLPFRQKAAQASQSLGTKGALKASLQSDKASYAGTAKIEHASLGSEAGSSAMEPSHLRITDAATAAVVNELSPYEIQGLQRQAEYGDQFAALALGMAYEMGHYVHPSCTKAAEWIAFAAMSGNAAAQYNLALRYFQGDGVPQDPQEGKKWLRIAAARGYPKPALAAEAR